MRWTSRSRQSVSKIYHTQAAEEARGERAGNMVKEAKQSKGVHACPRCDGTFVSPSKRDQHVRTVHEKRRDHACPHCAAAFGEAGHLTKHVRTVHEKHRGPRVLAATAPMM